MKGANKVAAGSPIPKIRLEKRLGKAVTVIAGLHTYGAKRLDAIARELKSTLATGGTVKNGTIEIQGDKIEPIKKWFTKTKALLLVLCFIFSFYPGVYAENTDVPVIETTLTGNASWYYGFIITGNKFFRNGHYAAMWDVPLGTKVRVTDLDNGRSIVVTINDRGPNKRLVAKGRIIDLAAKAFYDLNGDFKPSTIKVKLEILR